MGRTRDTHVLGVDDYDAMILALKGLDDVPGVIAKATSCGVNCDEYTKMLEYTRQALEAMVKVWFPKGRPK